MNAIQIIQSVHNEQLDKFFTIVSNIMSPEIVIVIGCIIFWCSNKRFGYAFMLTVCSGISLNILFKNMFRVPRPEYRLDTPIRVVGAYPDLYAFPSGHAQTAAMTFGVIGKKLKNLWFVIGASLTALVCISRMYLGMHTLGDVVIGVVIGIIWSVIGFKTYDMVFSRGEPMYLLIYLIPSVLSIFSVTKLWFGAYAPVDDVYNIFAVSVSLVAGAIIEHLYIRFVPEQNIIKQVIKCLVGIGVLVFIYKSLTNLIGDALGLEPFVFAVMGLWITVGLPLFSKFVIERWKLVNEEQK